jgi:hypothetical protein
MRRLFWLALGASLGVLIVRRLSRMAERMTPQGIAGSLGAGLSDLAAAIRDFSDDVRGAMSSQEAELRAAAGLDAGAATALTAGQLPPGPAGDLAATASPTADRPAGR